MKKRTKMLTKVNKIKRQKKHVRFEKIRDMFVCLFVWFLNVLVNN